MQICTLFYRNYIGIRDIPKTYVKIFDIQIPSTTIKLLVIQISDFEAHRKEE